jgi:hypothetical protein
MKKLILALLAACVCCVGCGDVPNSEPKLAPTTKRDPRLKPASSTGTQKGTTKSD